MYIYIYIYTIYIYIYIYICSQTKLPADWSAQESGCVGLASLLRVGGPKSWPTNLGKNTNPFNKLMPEPLHSE